MTYVIVSPPRIDHGEGGREWDVTTPSGEWIARIKAFGDYWPGDPNMSYGLESPRYNEKEKGLRDGSVITLTWEHLDKALSELENDVINGD